MGGCTPAPAAPPPPPQRRATRLTHFTPSTISDLPRPCFASCSVKGTSSCTNADLMTRNNLAEHLTWLRKQKNNLLSGPAATAFLDDNLANPVARSQTTLTVKNSSSQATDRKPTILIDLDDRPTASAPTPRSPKASSSNAQNAWLDAHRTKAEMEDLEPLPSASKKRRQTPVTGQTRDTSTVDSGATQRTASVTFSKAYLTCGFSQTPANRMQSPQHPAKPSNLRVHPSPRTHHHQPAHILPIIVPLIHSTSQMTTSTGRYWIYPPVVLRPRRPRRSLDHLMILDSMRTSQPYLPTRPAVARRGKAMRSPRSFLETTTSNGQMCMKC